MTDYYTELPDDLLYQVALQLNLKELFQQCRVSKRMAVICNNNNFWHQRYLLDLGANAINWQKEYTSRLEKIDKPQQYWEQRYNREFGDDINFKTRYLDYIRKKLISDLSTPLYQSNKHSEIYDPKSEIYAYQIVDYFIKNLVARQAISLPGLESQKTQVEDVFRFLLRNYREQHPGLQKLYNEIFVL